MEAVHPLRAWRKEHKISPDLIERETGLSPSHLSQLERGKKGISLAKAVRIERFTNGAVPATALVPIEVAE